MLRAVVLLPVMKVMDPSCRARDPTGAEAGVTAVLPSGEPAVHKRHVLAQASSTVTHRDGQTLTLSTREQKGPELLNGALRTVSCASAMSVR